MIVSFKLRFNAVPKAVLYASRCGTSRGKTAVNCCQNLLSPWDSPSFPNLLRIATVNYCYSAVLGLSETPCSELLVRHWKPSFPNCPFLFSGCFLFLDYIISHLLVNVNSFLGKIVHIFCAKFL